VSEVTPVGVAAEKVEDIVAEAVSTAAAVIRDEFDKVIADFRERLSVLNKDSLQHSKSLKY